MSVVLGELLAERLDDQHPCLLFEEQSWTWAQYAHACVDRANLLLKRRVDGPFHVGVLLDNVPDFVMLLGAAALSGAVVVGLNPTRRGPELARDVAQTDCQLIITEQRYHALLGEVGDDRPERADPQYREGRSGRPHWHRSRADRCPRSTWNPTTSSC